MVELDAIPYVNVYLLHSLLVDKNAPALLVQLGMLLNLLVYLMTYVELLLVI